MSNHPIAIKKYFTVVSETNVNITKSITLGHNVFARIDTLCTETARYKDIELTVNHYNEYEYITETQYKNILTLMAERNPADITTSNISEMSERMANLIREKAALVSKIIQMPVISYSFGKTNDKEFIDKYRKLYKHYEYMLNVVYADVLDSGGRMTPLQMKQMNVINKEINKKTLWEI